MVSTINPFRLWIDMQVSCLHTSRIPVPRSTVHHCQHGVQELTKVKGVSETAAAVIAYTERHLARMDRLLRSSFLLDYTLDRLHVVSPLVSPQLSGYQSFACEAVCHVIWACWD